VGNHQFQFVDRSTDGVQGIHRPRNVSNAQRIAGEGQCSIGHQESGSGRTWPRTVAMAFLVLTTSGHVKPGSSKMAGKQRLAEVKVFCPATEAGST